MELITLLGMDMSERSEKREIKLNRIDDMWDENIKRLLSNPKNYQYDCRIAVLLLAGEKYALTFGRGIEWDESIFPPEEENRQYSGWGYAFEKITQGKQFQSLFGLNDEKSERIDRFSYTGMKEMHIKLEKEIQKQINAEMGLKKLINKEELAEDEEKVLLRYSGKGRVAEKKRRELKGLFDKDNITKEEEDMLWNKILDKDVQQLVNNILPYSSESKVESYYLEDIVLGNSFTVELYHCIKMIAKKFDMEFWDFKSVIKTLVQLKCYQMRNVLTELVFCQMKEELIKNKGYELKKMDVFNEKLSCLVKQVNNYYGRVLRSQWEQENFKFSKMDIKEVCCEINLRANSIKLKCGSIITDNEKEKESDDYDIESYADFVVRKYFNELEKDMSQYYNADDYYLESKEYLRMDLGIEPFKLRRKKDETEGKWDICLCDSQSITDDEYMVIKNKEEKEKIRRERTRQSVFNPSALFKLIRCVVIEASSRQTEV